VLGGLKLATGDAESDAPMGTVGTRSRAMPIDQLLVIKIVRPKAARTT
jgi:hypothetical protein